MNQTRYKEISLTLPRSSSLRTGNEAGYPKSKNVLSLVYSQMVVVGGNKLVALYAQQPKLAHLVLPQVSRHDGGTARRRVPAVAAPGSAVAAVAVWAVSSIVDDPAV